MIFIPTFSLFFFLTGKKTETLVNKVGLDGGPATKVIKTEPGLNINTASATATGAVPKNSKHGENSSTSKSGGGCERWM